MHGINVENKGFKSVTDYVRVRYIPSASSKAYVGQKVKGAYWNGVLGAHPGGFIGLSSDISAEPFYMDCSETGFRWTNYRTYTWTRGTAGAIKPGHEFRVYAVPSKAEESTYAHTILF